MPRLKRDLSIPDLQSKKEFDLRKNNDLRCDTGIITAVSTEFEAVFEKMKKYCTPKEFIFDEGTEEEKKFFVGEMQGQTCVLSMSGVGTEDAAICADRMVNSMVFNFRPRRIINVGSAGTYVNSDVNIGDLVISAKCVRSDVDLTIFEGYKKGSFEKFRDPFISANPYLIKCAEEAVKELNIPYHIGTILTSNSFVNDPKLKESILKEFNAICDEMEGASIARYCEIREIPFVVLRCVSDKPINKDKLMYFDHYKDAAKRCADIVEKFLYCVTKSKDRDFVHSLEQRVNKLEDKIVKTGKTVLLP